MPSIAQRADDVKQTATIGELTPVRPRRFVSTEDVLVTFRGAAPLDGPHFRDEVDAVLDQDATPRA